MGKNTTRARMPKMLQGRYGLSILERQTSKRKSSYVPEGESMTTTLEQPNYEAYPYVSWRVTEYWDIQNLDTNKTIHSFRSFKDFSTQAEAEQYAKILEGKIGFTYPRKYPYVKHASVVHTRLVIPSTLSSIMKWRGA